MSWHDDVSEPSEVRRSLQEHARRAMLAALRAELEALPGHVLRDRYLDFLHRRPTTPTLPGNAANRGIIELSAPDQAFDQTPDGRRTA